MKAKHYSLFILAAAMLSCLASCRPDEEPSPEPLNIDIKVTDLTPETAQVTVTPSHDNSTYYWNVRPQDEYESFKDVHELQDADLADLQESASSAGEGWPEYLLKILSRGLVSEKIEMLQPQETYCAYAYELNEDGTAAGSAVASVLFTTPKEQCRVKLEIPSTGMTFIEVNAVPEDNDIRYYFDQMPESMYLQYGGTDEGAAHYFRESLEYTAENRGWTIEQVVEAISLFGRSNRKIEGLDLDTEYRIYAVEIDEAGNVLNVTSTLTSTLERQMSDLTIEINVNTLNSFRTEVEFKPSNDKESYYYQMLPLEEYEKIVENYGDYRDYAINKYGAEAMSTFTATGTTIATGKNLLSETDYIIFAFGFQDGTWVTDMFTKIVKTPAPNPANTLNINIEILETTNHYCNISFQPSDETIPYMYYYMTENEYINFGNDTLTSVQEYVTQYLATYQELYPEMSIPQLVQALSKRANQTNNFKYLDPSTKYYAWAVSVDENGLIASNPALKEFTTGEWIVAENCIIKSVEYRYWNGDELAENLIQFITYKGIPAAIVDTVNVEGSKTWFGYFYKGNLMDIEKYPDHYISSNLYFTGRENVSQGSITVFRLDWSEWTLCIAATDENGNFGPVYRELVEPTKDGCSPLEEFPLYDRLNSPAMKFTIPYRPDNSGTFRYLPEIDLSSITKTYGTTPKQAAASGPVFEKTEKGNAGNVTEKNQPDILLHVK